MNLLAFGVLIEGIGIVLLSAHLFAVSQRISRHSRLIVWLNDRLRELEDGTSTVQKFDSQQSGTATASEKTRIA